MNYLHRLNTLLENGLAKIIFDHIRNYLMCSFLLATGILAFKDQTGLLFGQISLKIFNFSGAGIIALSIFFFIINFLDGIRQISAYKYHRMIELFLIFFYSIASIRIIELAWSFRM